MRSLILKYTVASIAILSLGACATSQSALQGQLSHQEGAELGQELGMATRANVLAHAVAPTAAQKANTFIPANRARTALTRTQYEEGDTPEPKTGGY